MAISSAFTNSLQLSISGKMLKEAVVLPAPLQPEMMYSFFFLSITQIYKMEMKNGRPLEETIVKAYQLLTMFEKTSLEPRRALTLLATVNHK